MGFACGYVGRVQYPVQYTYCIVRDVVQLCATLHFARNAFVQLEQAFLCGAYHFIMRDLQFDLVQLCAIYNMLHCAGRTVQLRATFHLCKKCHCATVFLYGAYYHARPQFDLLQLCAVLCAIAALCDFPLVQEMPLCKFSGVWHTILVCETHNLTLCNHVQDHPE